MKYFINGLEVTHDEAKECWLSSPSYERANSKARDSIWLSAHEKDGGSSGEINWLNEAGVYIATNNSKEIKNGMD